MTLRLEDVAGWARSITQRRLELPADVRDELLMLDLDALAYLQANGNYTQVMYIASKGPLVSLGLSKLEAYIRAALPAGDRLPLVRLGRSLLVNQSFLVQISVTSQKLVLSDNAGHTHVLSAPKPLLKQYKDILSGRAAGKNTPRP